MIYDIFDVFEDEDVVFVLRKQQKDTPISRTNRANLTVM